MTTDRPAPAQPFDRARFWRLLGQYFFGVAIGCVLVGVILNLKKWYMPPPPVQATPHTPSGQAPPPPDAVAPTPGSTPETASPGPAK